MQLNTAILKAGTTLYHGTCGEDFEESSDGLEGPAWVTDSEEVARYFAVRYEGSRPRIVVYELTEDVELPEILTQRDMAHLVDEYDISTCGAEDICDSVRHSPLKGWYIPNNYPEGADILLRDTQLLAYRHTIDIQQPVTRPSATAK